MIRDLVDGADLLFTNEYESHLLQQKTGWDADEVLPRVGTWITTRAAEGILVRQADAEPISVIAVPETKPVEPTGGGDALRAGFIAGRMWGLGLERATQLGSAVATAAVEVIGTQEYDLPKESFLPRFAEPSAPTPPTRSPRTCREAAQSPRTCSPIVGSSSHFV